MLDNRASQRGRYASVVREPYRLPSVAAQAKTGFRRVPELRRTSRAGSAF